MATTIRRLAAALGLSMAASTVQGQDCQSLQHLGDTYTVCSVAEAERIDLWLADSTGAILGEFSAVDAQLAPRGLKLQFAMNGGMYHEDRRAVGYFVNADGQSQELMTRPGPGNFGLLPNGVFCVADGQARVLETLAFRDSGLSCRIATQSGPMLVINGQLHPKFLPDSTSRKWRNGVGVDAKGATFFAISDGAVRFHDFATLFRDVLNCPNALFLDGSISRLHAPEIGRSDLGAKMGPILGVTAPLN